jgi:hypothetical protein
VTSVYSGGGDVGVGFDSSAILASATVFEDLLWRERKVGRWWGKVDS